MENEQDSKQICTISVGFPCRDDVEALEVKRKIEEATKEIEKVRIDFRIVNVGKPNVGI